MYTFTMFTLAASTFPITLCSKCNHPTPHTHLRLAIITMYNIQWSPSNMSNQGILLPNTVILSSFMSLAWLVMCPLVRGRTIMSFIVLVDKIILSILVNLERCPLACLARVSFKHVLKERPLYIVYNIPHTHFWIQNGHCSQFITSFPHLTTLITKL